jgi:hypothetical protein
MSHNKNTASGNEKKRKNYCAAEFELVKTRTVWAANFPSWPIFKAMLKLSPVLMSLNFKFCEVPCVEPLAGAEKEVTGTFSPTLIVSDLPL